MRCALRSFRRCSARVYLGQVRYRDETHPGEHPAIVDVALWQQVQTLLQENRCAGRKRRDPGALLQGLLHCLPCGCAMIASHTTKGNKRYCYYVCAAAQKHGWQTCPAPSVAAGAIERLVVEQIHRSGLDPATPDQTAAWEALTLAAQMAKLRGLIERIDYDGVQGKVSMAFKPGASAHRIEGLTREDS